MTQEEVLSKITDSMTAADDLKDAGINIETLDPDTQRKITFKFAKNALSGLKEAERQYKAMKEKYPDVYIEALEGPDLPPMPDERYWRERGI